MALSFVATTTHCNTFLLITDTLSTVLADAVLVVTPEGIKLGQFDGKNASLVNLFLRKEGFDAFECAGHYCVGLNLTSLFKVTKTLKHAIEITLLQYDTSYLEVRATLPDRNVVHKVTTLELQNEFVDFPDKPYEIKSEFASTKLHETLRTMSNLAEHVSFYVPHASNPRKYLEMRCQGSFTEQNVVFEENDFFTLHQRAHSDPMCGTYCLKLLTQFAKCVHLNKRVHVLLSNELPLVLRYELTDKWTLTFAVAQAEEKKYRIK